MQSVLNVRMDSALKERGDKVLAEHGISVSNAVRALWAQLASTRALPEFLQDAEGHEEAKRAKRAALEKLTLLGEAFQMSGTGSSDYDAMMDEMYADKWARYEALS